MTPTAEGARRVLARAARSGLAILHISAAIALCQDVDQNRVPYERKLYEHWIDADGDCLDTRQEVLIAESQSPAKLDPAGCRVVAGHWLDPYTGQRVVDPSMLDIDHLIPLAEAHRSGADSWTPEQRRRFANDLLHPEALIAVTAGSNRSKGSRDPALWLPPNEGFRCEYVRQWLITKAIWGLDMDPAEREAIRDVLWKCGAVPEQRPEDGGPEPGPAVSGDRSDTAASAESGQATLSGVQQRGGDAATESGAAEPSEIEAGDTAAVAGSGPSADPESPDAFCEQLARTPCIDINTATLGTLECAKGLGQVKSQAIIDYRASNGPVQELGELDDVPGIGPATIDSIRDSGFCVGPQVDIEGSEPAATPQR